MMDYSWINEELQLATKWDKEQSYEEPDEANCGVEEYLSGVNFDSPRFFNDMFDRTELTDEEWEGTDWNWKVKKARYRSDYWKQTDGSKAVYKPPTPPQYSEKDPRLQSNEEWLRDYEEALGAEKSGYRKPPLKRNR